MAWEISWRVVTPTGRHERAEPFAIEGERIEFVLYNSVVGIERRARESSFWRERFNLRVFGSRPLPAGPVYATDEAPLIVAYDFRWTGQKRLQFGGRPAPPRVARHSMSESGLRPIVPTRGEAPEDVSSEPPLVVLEQAFTVYQPDSSLGRQVRREYAPQESVGEQVASAQGPFSADERRRREREEQIAEDAARRERIRRREEELATAARRTRVREMRREILAERADMPGLVPLRILGVDEFERLEDVDAAAYLMLLQDAYDVTPLLDLHRQFPTVIADDGSPIQLTIHWLVDRTERSVRLYQSAVPNDSRYSIRPSTWETTPYRRYQFALDDLLKVRLPDRDEIAVMDARTLDEEMFRDQLWATAQFVAIEIISAVLPRVSELLMPVLRMTGRFLARSLQTLFRSGIDEAALSAARRFMTGRQMARLTGGMVGETEEVATRALRAETRGLRPVQRGAGLARGTGTERAGAGRMLGAQRGRGEAQIGGRTVARQARRRATRAAARSLERAGPRGPYHATSAAGQALERQTLDRVRARAAQLITRYERQGLRHSAGAAGRRAWAEARQQVRRLVESPGYVRQTLTGLQERLTRVSSFDHPSNTLAIGRFMTPEGTLIDVVGRSSGGLTPALRQVVEALPLQSGAVRAVAATPIRHAHAEWEVLLHGLSREWVPIALRTNVNICTGICTPFLEEVGFQVAQVGGRSRPLAAIWMPWRRGQWRDF